MATTLEMPQPYYQVILQLYSQGWTPEQIQGLLSLNFTTGDVKKILRAEREEDGYANG